MKSKQNLPARLADAPRDDTWRTRRLGSTLLLSQADVTLLDALKPRCMRCGRQVDAISWTRVPSRPMHVRFSVECHGETEETFVSFDELPVLLGGAVQGAEAFREPKKLTHET